MTNKSNSNEPNICPCEQCISLAMCKHRQYDILIKHCHIIREHIAKAEQPSMRAADFMDLMEGKVTI